MKNPRCVTCQNKTKLLLKLPGRMNYTYICKKASACPFTQKEQGQETKLRLEQLKK